jgi:hypothetical protein
VPALAGQVVMSTTTAQRLARHAWRRIRFTGVVRLTQSRGWRWQKGPHGLQLRSPRGRVWDFRSLHGVGAQVREAFDPEEILT